MALEGKGKNSTKLQRRSAAAMVRLACACSRVVTAACHDSVVELEIETETEKWPYKPWAP